MARGQPAKKGDPEKGAGRKLIAQNKRARFDYHIESTVEAGMVLLGTEVKSCRDGKVQLQDSWVKIKRGEAYLMGAHIAEYTYGNQFNHEPRRERKLLLHAKEIERLDASQQKKGKTIVPLQMYLKKGKLKIELGLGTGKAKGDKRQSIKERETKREMQRTLRRNNR